MKTTKTTRVLLADDHQIVLEGLRQLLQGTFDVVGCAGGGHELVSMAQRLKPEVIITDIGMPDLGGVEAVQEIRASGAPIPAVFLTMLGDAKTALNAFEAGGNASGYVLKNSAGTELVTAVQEVLAGRSYMTPRITSEVLHECFQKTDRIPEGITQRQADVLRLIAAGKTMKEVANILNISTRTAEAHKYQMMEHLGIKNVAQLVQFAIQQGLVQLSPAMPGGPVHSPENSLVCIDTGARRPWANREIFLPAYSEKIRILFKQFFE